MVTIIIPTYNDSTTIIETLNSVKNQTYDDIEVIVVDDGSTDNTKNNIEKYKEQNLKMNSKIKYIYQENKDQLNAILNGMEYINGEYVFILHSDDVLSSNDVIEKSVNYMEKNPQYDAIIGDLTITNQEGKIVGKQVVNEYENKKHILPLQLLWLGRNLFIDVAFYRTNVLKSSVKYTYLTWNIPFWIVLRNNEIGMLKVKKIDYTFINYRVHSGNYINDIKGKLNVLNGELRTLTTIMKFYKIPLYKIQYNIFRIFNKIGILKIYRPIFIKKSQNNKGEIIEFVIKKRMGNEYKENKFLNAIVKFYNSTSMREISITIPDDENFIIYNGKDMRRFNEDLLNNKLNKFYLDILDEMQKGFHTIYVQESEYEKVNDICKFLCIYHFVEIKIK